MNRDNLQLDADYFKKQLNLQKHPEGGWFKETYRSNESILKDHLPERFTGDRNFSTAIYFLLEGVSFSAFHRIKSDELWHFYYGCGIDVYVISPAGELEIMKLGQELNDDRQMQGVVKAGSWFAAEVIDSNSFALAGCTVSPGFDFADFELASRQQLLNLFPQHETLISKFCRQ